MQFMRQCRSDELMCCFSDLFELIIIIKEDEEEEEHSSL